MAIGYGASMRGGREYRSFSELRYTMHVSHPGENQNLWYGPCCVIVAEGPDANGPV